MAIPVEWIETVHAWRSDPARASGPIGLVDLAREAHTLSSALLMRLEPLTAAQGPVSCSKGCGACCREVIPLSPPEVLLLSETHARLEWSRRAEVEERFVRNSSALAAAGLGEASLLDRAGDAFALGLPCPYLEDEACGIHPERPLVCREHLALSPSAWCGGFPDSFIRVLEMPVSVGQALSEIAWDLMGYREHIPIVRVREWLEANRHWADRRWEAGPLLDRLATLCPTGHALVQAAAK